MTAHEAGSANSCGWLDGVNELCRALALQGFNWTSPSPRKALSADRSLTLERL